MSEGEFNHTEQLVFFIDLLGSSDAVLNWGDAQRVESLTKMLRGVKEATRNFEITGFGRNKRIKFAMPAVSTFSDNVLISFDMQKMAADLKEPLAEAFWVAQMLIGAFALEALELGLLIRGGATLNSLYHHDGVAVGKGLIEAYELERSVARYPRIPVSRKVYQSPEAPFPEILTDNDGVNHFDYMSSMIGRDRKRLDAAGELADRNIALFEAREKWNEMSKWVWFRRHLEDVSL